VATPCPIRPGLFGLRRLQPCPGSDPGSDLVAAHAGWIKDEVLAVAIETDGGAEPRIAKA